MRRVTVLLGGIERGVLPPTLRLFQFKEPTVSYGRLQKLRAVAPRVPRGWSTVQRPTGGGIVFHERDQCVSLCWQPSQAPLPTRAKEIYPWIHSIILGGLGDRLRMAGCADVCELKRPFSVRECFQEPVGFDILEGKQKVVGGALYRSRAAFLYQGSIQTQDGAELENRLLTAFESALKSPHV